MENVLLNESPAYVDYVHRHVYHMQKFDLVLHHADGIEYDGSGCFPCLPWCRKPVYKPGEHISGHVLIKPMRKLTIIGVKILFEGLYRTDWRDKVRGIRWLGVRSFFQDCVNLIQNRVIQLDCKWYKFDFEYVLPRLLPSSSKETDCKIAYQASGLIIQPYDNTQIQTFNTPFIVDGPVDINSFPCHLQRPLTKCSVKHLDPNCTENNNPILSANNNQIINENQYSNNGSNINDMTTPQNRSCSDVSLNTYNLCCPLEHHVVSTLWLSRQLLVIGDQVQIELNIDNVTSEAIQARLNLIQTLKLKANYAVMTNSREILLPLDTYVQKTARSRVLEIWTGSLRKNREESFSLTFKVPSNAIPSQPCLTLPETYQQHVSELFSIPVATEALILRSYTIELEVMPPWGKAEPYRALWADVEIVKSNRKLSHRINNSLFGNSSPNQARLPESATEMADFAGEGQMHCDATVETALDDCCSPEDTADAQPRPHSWCAPPTDSEGPPAYEEEIRDRQNVQFCDSLPSL